MHFSLLLRSLPLTAAAGLSFPPSKHHVPASLHRSVRSSSTIPGKYIVKFKRDADPSMCHNDTHIKLSGETDHVYQGQFSGFARSLDEQQLDYIRHHHCVEYVAEDQYMTASSVVENPALSWGLVLLSHNTSDYQNYNTYVTDDTAGEGTCVYVLDSGVDDSHPEFEGRAKQIKSFIPEAKRDVCGHGTHVAGIIGSKTYGVAKKTNIYGVKILNDTTSAAEKSPVSAAIAAFDFVAKDRASRKCPKGVLVNLSAGCNGAVVKALDDAAAALVDQGVFVAVAAGDQRMDAAETSPGSEPSVCVVGAVYPLNRIDSSNHGPRVDVFAPGVSFSLKPGGGIELMSGTSVAAPFVTGLAAYLAALEGLSGTAALCRRIRELSNKDAIRHLPSGTGNRVVFNGAKPEEKIKLPTRHDRDGEVSPIKKGLLHLRLMEFYIASLTSSVFVCENEGFRQPCAWVEAPEKQCVALPDQFLNKVSSLDSTWFAGTCRFYDEAGCQGGSFQAAYSAYSDQGVNLTSEDSRGLGIFNNRLKSLQCDGEPITYSEDPHSLDGWVWSPQTQKNTCSRLDRLYVDFRASSGSDDGTLDTLRLEFVGIGERPHVMIEAPAAGFHGWQPVDLKSVFGYETIDVGRIRQLRINATQTTWRGGDPWGLSSIGLIGQCDESKVLVNNHRFASINRRLSFHHAVRHLAWNRYTAWEGYTGPEDWAPDLPCSHFEPLEVYLETANEYSAGTDNAIYVKMGKIRRRIAERLWLGQTYNLTIQSEDGRPPKPIPVALKDVDYVEFESDGGYDQVKLASELAKMIRMCAGIERKFRVEREIDEWIADKGKWGFRLNSSDWREYQ
ncbi:hypothetical protein L249_3198 [Ophiocordyceps polyrhachis-furcata BCC 54312]|uniref:Subtilisin-like protease n=1 Tax=Ophiocordyceps polyrhachis-furcata BCC 54312 TaxID=1330021 RepID=A0A367LS35_9HYPO|nr:hypothetical protein L249_3198 [Ophiocordyceps polyrhachis-furcata BCC 54312]